MKYSKKISPTDKDLSETLVKDGWKKIKEPKSLVIAICLSLPFMLFNGIACYYVIHFFYKGFDTFFNSFMLKNNVSVSIRFDYVFLMYILIYLHEMIHAILIPNFIKSEKTYYGIRPWGGFVFTTEIISKSRFLLICIAPFIVLSVMLPVILGLFNLLNGVLAFIIMINAFASSVDIFNALLILFQVPNRNLIVNNGFETYYKENIDISLRRNIK